MLSTLFSATQQKKPHRKDIYFLLSYLNLAVFKVLFQNNTYIFIKVSQRHGWIKSSISEPIFIMWHQNLQNLISQPYFHPILKYGLFWFPLATLLPIFQSITLEGQRQTTLNYKATSSYSFILKQRQLQNPEITGILLPNNIYPARTWEPCSIALELPSLCLLFFYVKKII